MLDNNNNEIKDILKKVFTENKKLERGYSAILLEKAWKTEMGPVITKYTNRLYYANGRLIVYLTSAPLRSELGMSKSKLINILNKKCGKNLVKEIILK